MLTTTPSLSNDDIESHQSDKQAIKLLKSLSTRLTLARILSPSDELTEGHSCTFQGNRPDPYSCQCRNW